MTVVVRCAVWRGESACSLVRQARRLAFESSAWMPVVVVGFFVAISLQTPLVAVAIVFLALWALYTRMVRPTEEVLSLMDAPSRVPQYPVEIGVWRDGVFLGDDQGIAMIVGGSFVFSGLLTEFSLGGDSVQAFDSPLHRWRMVRDATLRTRTGGLDSVRQYPYLTAPETFPLRLRLAYEPFLEVGIKPYPSDATAERRLEDLRNSLEPSLAEYEPTPLRIAGWPISPRYDPIRRFHDFMFRILFTSGPFYRAIFDVQHPFAEQFDEWATNRWGSDEYVVLPPVRPQRQALSLARAACAVHATLTVTLAVTGIYYLRTASYMENDPSAIFAIIQIAMALVGAVTFPSKLAAIRKLNAFDREPSPDPV